MQTGKADGISYILTPDDEFGAVDIDHCRNANTHSIDVWAQNFLDVGRNTYSEVTPSGTGCRIWGLADGDSLHKKYTLEIDGNAVAVELFRRTNKALTITGYRLDTIRELTNIDRLFEWALVWGERRKAAAAEAAASAGNGFNANGNGSGYAIEQIEQIVREGAPAGSNRSDFFHTIVGHYLGCGWGLEQIQEHLEQFPNGIGSRYIAEGRLSGEIARSASNTPPAPCRCSMPAPGSTAGTPRRRHSRSSRQNRNPRSRSRRNDPELEEIPSSRTRTARGRAPGGRSQAAAAVCTRRS